MFSLPAKIRKYKMQRKLLFLKNVFHKNAFYSQIPDEAGNRMTLMPVNVLTALGDDHGITESSNHSSWKGPLKVSQSNSSTVSRDTYS